MKRRIYMLLVTIIMAVALVGCGKKTISNDRITIDDYKKLEVTDATDEEAVWEALLKKCTVKEYPQEELETLIGTLETEYSYVAYYEGKTASEFIEEIHGMSSEELAKKQLMKEYAIALIAEKEELNMTDEEYQKELQEAAKEHGFEHPEEYESLFEEEELRHNLLEARVLKFLLEQM